MMRRMGRYVLYGGIAYMTGVVAYALLDAVASAWNYSVY